MKNSEETVVDLGKALFWVFLGCATIVLAMGGCGYLWNANNPSAIVQSK